MASIIFCSLSCNVIVLPWVTYHTQWYTPCTHCWQLLWSSCMQWWVELARCALA